MVISEIINYLKDHINQTDITLYPGVSNNLINKIEKSLGVKLPDDMRLFYEFSNGFESEEDAFRIIPIEEIEWSKKGNGEPQLVIAEYLIYCDMWYLDVNPLDHNDYKICHGVVLTDSFAEFLQRFLTGGVFEKAGLYDWKDEVLAKNSN